MKKKILSIILLISLLISSNISFAQDSTLSNTIDVNIDDSKDLSDISPLIYNTNPSNIGYPIISTYNWENNYGYATSDYNQTSIESNELFFPSLNTQPNDFYNNIFLASEKYKLLPIQSAGYVSADKDGQIKTNEVAPSSRFKKVVPVKNSAFELIPDTTDDYVYTDEMINSLVNKFGNASSKTGVNAYSIGFEPSQWNKTLPSIHPNKTACTEIVSKSIEFSKSIKNVDPFAEIYSPSFLTSTDCINFSDAPDWKNNLDKNYSSFLDYYLDQMKINSEKEGKRLIDVLDLHFIPDFYQKTESSDDARYYNKMYYQSINYNKEIAKSTSILSSGSTNTPSIQSIRESIDKYNPGTKLSFSNYTFDNSSVSESIATADLLGTFAKNNVYYASTNENLYTKSAISMYSSRYGNKNIQCDISDSNLTSSYASINQTAPNKLYIVLINKDHDNSKIFNVNLNSSKSFQSTDIQSLDAKTEGNLNNILTNKMPVEIVNNKFNINIPPMSAYSIILDTSKTLTGDLNKDGKISSTDLALLLKENLISRPIEYSPKDINFDYLINELDVEMYTNYLYGLTKTFPEQIKENGINPNFSITKSEISNNNFHFTSHSTDTKNNILYQNWDFGDGTENNKYTYTKRYYGKASGGLVRTRTDIFNEHTYSTPGKYTVTLTVYNYNGMSAKTSQEIIVADN